MQNLLYARETNSIEMNRTIIALIALAVNGDENQVYFDKVEGDHWINEGCHTL